MDFTAFSPPAPVEVSIRSGLPRTEVIDRLANAIDERRYSSPGRLSPGYFRLGGSIAAERVTVTARPYVTPGLIAGYGAMTIELRGEVVEGDSGSVVRGDVSAPIRWTTPAWLGFAWILWVAFAIVSNGSTLWSWVFVVVGSVVIAAAWIWTIRHNQRMALRKVDELTRMLSSILSGAPSRAG